MSTLLLSTFALEFIRTQDVFFYVRIILKERVAQITHSYEFGAGLSDIKIGTVLQSAGGGPRFGEVDERSSTLPSSLDQRAWPPA